VGVAVGWRTRRGFAARCGREEKEDFLAMILRKS